MIPKDVQAEILNMLEADQQLLRQIASEKNLADTYHAELRDLHNRHADRLQDMVAQYGWPRRAEVGEKVARASWVLLQHSIERPEFIQAMLALFQSDKSLGVDAADMARLEDRIRVFRGQKQIYGTNFDWTAAGKLEPTPIEAPEHVDARRQSMGLPPLADDWARMANTDEKPPQDWQQKQREAQAWAVHVGWRPE
jgi:hypothetical protein